MGTLWQTDRDVALAIKRERERQNKTINLIAAENYASLAVLEAQGSLMTNKYAEGYPGHRYYGGCQYVDEVESLAIQRATQLFGVGHANVQPHSGSQANMAAYLAVLHPGDRVVGMSLANGGHLTHGSAVNFSGRLFSFIPYGVDRKTERLDYDQLERLAQENRPQLIIAGASAYSQILDFPRFQDIARKTGARLLVDMAHIAGLVAAGVHPSPIPYAEIVTSSTHKTLRGPRGGFILCRQELASLIDSSVFPGLQGGPLMHVIAAKAVAFQEAMQPEFVAYQKAVVANAQLLAAELDKGGLRIVSGDTQNHLLLVDMTALGITGRAAEVSLEQAGIIANRNAIPFDPRPPQITSGLRLGTPAVTTRSFGSQEIGLVARWILKVLQHIDDWRIHKQVRQEVEELCLHFPIPRVPGPEGG